MQPKHEATLTQPLQCDLQRLNCKAQQNDAQRRLNWTSKTGSRRKREKKIFWSTFKKYFKRKITSAKMEKICWQIIVAACMQPLQYDLRDPAAKDNSITNAATARSNPDATTRHCGNDPTVAKHNGLLSATHPPATLAIPFTVRERS